MKLFEQQYQAILEQLLEMYPDCFKLSGRLRRPLMVGIHKQLEAKFPQPGLRHALSFYTSHFRYLEALKEGAARIGLDGEPTGTTVSEAEAKYARELLRGYAPRTERKAPPAPKLPPPAVITGKRDGLSALKQAAQARQRAS